MPNHVRSIVKIKATPTLLKFVRETIKGSQEERQIIDFEKIKPMPDYIYRGDLGEKEGKEYSKENCWYDWSFQNWSTKWNAYSQGEFSTNEIYFETAWSMPYSVFVELSRQFPEAEFSVRYADEDTGSNCGSVTFKAGNVVKELRHDNRSKTSVSFANRIWNRQ